MADSVVPEAGEYRVWVDGYQPVPSPCRSDYFTGVANETFQVRLIASFETFSRC